MALPQESLFCPDCMESGELLINPRNYYEVSCTTCGQKWEHNELNGICHRLINRAESDRSFKHWAACLRIQMQHTINPNTGMTYA